MTLRDLETTLATRGLTSFRAFFAGGVWWVICRAGVGTGTSLAEAVEEMVCRVQGGPAPERRSQAT